MASAAQGATPGGKGILLHIYTAAAWTGRSNFKLNAGTIYASTCVRGTHVPPRLRRDYDGPAERTRIANFSLIRKLTTELKLKNGR